MPRDASFWRNAAIVAVLHIIVLAGVARWSGNAKQLPPPQVVWLDAGALSAATNAVQSTQVALVAPEEEEPAPVPEPQPADDSLMIPTPPPSEVEQPAPPPTPAPTSTPRPTPPPKAAPKSTPQPTPKKALAKTTPKPSASPKKQLAVKKPAPKSPPKTETPAEAESAPAAESPGTTEGSSSGSGSGASGATSASDVGWYGKMLHDRFHGEWVQPKTAAATGSRMSALVQLRIEKDGRVSDFRIVSSSGNVVVDESIAAVAKRVTRVDAPPAALSASGHYDVRIRFELDVE